MNTFVTTLTGPLFWPTFVLLVTLAALLAVWVLLLILEDGEPERTDREDRAAVQGIADQYWAGGTDSFPTTRPTMPGRADRTPLAETEPVSDEPIEDGVEPETDEPEPVAPAVNLPPLKYLPAIRYDPANAATVVYEQTLDALYGPTEALPVLELADARAV